MSESTTQSTQKQQRRKKSRPSTTQKDLALSLLEPLAKPIPVSDLFAGFWPTQHGNCSVDIDPNFIGRVMTGFADQIQNVHSSGTPGTISMTETFRVTSMGLHLGLALKLLQSAPESDLMLYDEFLSLSNVSIELPDSFLPILDLVGKTTHEDLVIRIQESNLLFKQSILRAVHQGSKSRSFHDFNCFNGDQVQRMVLLSRIRDVDLENIMFSTNEQAKKIQRMGREQLDGLLRNVFDIDLGENRVLHASPPYLPKSSTKRQVIEWSTRLNPAFNTGPLLLGALLSIFEVSWLKRPNERFGIIDPIFQDTDFGQITPGQALQAAGLSSIYEFFESDEFFKTVCLNSFRYYTGYAHHLNKVFKMSTMPRNPFGSIAQLVLLPKSDLVNYENQVWSGETSVQVPNVLANTVYCSRDLKQVDKIILAGTVGLSRGVRYANNYRGMVRINFREIISRIGRQSIHK